MLWALFQWIGWIAFYLSQAAYAASPPVILAVGEQREITIPDLERFSLGNDCVRAWSNPGRKSLLIKGIRPGSTDLWILKKDRTTEIRTLWVQSWTLPSLPLGVPRALDGLSEAEVLVQAEGFVLRGTIRSPEEARKIALATATYPKWILDHTLWEPELQEAMLKKAQAWLRAGNHPKLWTEAQGERVWIRGSVRDPDTLATIERVILERLPGVRSGLKSMPDANPTIYFQVYLLEIKHDDFQSLGIRWPGNDGAGIPAFRVTPWKLQNEINFDLGIDLLAGKGLAKVLAKPELVVRAPGEAELFAGGELPIRQRSGMQLRVDWRAYGLKLTLKTAHSDDSRVRLDILAEVSQLDGATTNDEIPSVRVNRMKTQVDAAFGSPLLLCGLFQERQRRHARGIPGLREIPWLGTLFGSEDFLNERSELVVILLPHTQAPPEISANTLRKLEIELPRGKAPPSRNWVSPSEERRLKDASDYPWNALN